MATTAAIADKNKGTVTASTQTFSLKSGVDSKGQHRDYIEGFLATTHLDKGQDRFTPEALKMMAEDISGDEVNAIFRDVDQDELREAQTGNIDHDTNPANPFGDTRTVPAFKTVDAEVRQTNDGETGLWIKGVLNSDGMPGDTVSAVKNSIRDGFLNAFSIEFVPEKVRQVTENEKVVRVIESAKAKGAALTGRPMNPEARMTGSQLKSMASEYKVEYSYDIGDEVSWNTAGGTASGTIRDRSKDSCFNEEIDGDVEVCGSEEAPAYLIEVDDSDGTMVGHKQDTLNSKAQHMEEEEGKAELSEDERTPPQAAQENAQMALDAKEETGNPNDCGTSTGWTRAEQLSEGGAVSEDVISRMSQFARHRDNSEQGEEGRADCGWMMWKAWGGDEGVEWAQRQMDKLENKNNIQSKVDDPSIQEPDYEAVSEASWEKPAASDFPDDYNTNTIFVVAEQGSDNFSDHALPVVDYRNDEPTLVLEALRSAHTLAAQVDGLNDEQVSRARSMIENLAEDEFDVMLGDEADSEHMEKNDITMTDEKVSEEEVEEEAQDVKSEAEPEAESEEEVEESDVDQEESEEKSFSEDIDEIKETVSEVKSVNEELREENEELKSELEDLRQLQEIKSEVDDVKSMLEDVDLEDGPRAQTEQKDRFEDQESKADWKKAADRVGADYLKGRGSMKSNLEAFAENHGIDTQEVKNYVNSD